MNIFLTGASGLVGSAFARVASRRGHHVVGVTGTFVGRLPGVASQLALDLAQLDAVTRSVLETFPDVIVNCAAVSEPAACETNPAQSEAMNVALPGRLADLAHHLGARLLHISSEQVFDGVHSTRYSTQDAVSPINLYGRQKVASERAVLASAPERTVVIRAPLLMGDSPGGRRALHERLFADWSAGRSARLYTDEFRQPCTAENLAEVLCELTERPDVNGTYHWAGAGLHSRFDLGVKIRTHFKLAECVAPIAAITRADTPEISRCRQACLALDISRLSGRLKTQPQTIDEQLAGLRVPLACREWYLRQGSAIAGGS
jgi:dTDP-4-dehydrorhamnose reductase